MRRTLSIAAIIFASLIGTLVFEACGKLYQANPGLGSSAPHLVHVYNGSTVGYYSTTGAYGFGTAANSIFALAQNFGTGQQIVQNQNDGSFLIGTTACTGGCNYLIFFSGYSEGYRSSQSFSASSTIMTANGTSRGVALNTSMNRIYVADDVHNTVGFVTTTGSLNPSTPFIAPTGYGAKYVGVDPGTNVLAVIENVKNAAWFMDATSGAFITSNPNPLNLTGSGCTTPGMIAVNSTLHLGYVLCGNTVVFISMQYNQPGYGISNNLASSTVTLTNITAATDILFNTFNNTVVIGGQHYVTAIDQTSGAARANIDLLTGDCGLGSMTISGLAMWTQNNLIFALDSANNKFYVLNGTTLAFANGKCSNSSFSTADVPGATRISFF